MDVRNMLLENGAELMEITMDQIGIIRNGGDLKDGQMIWGGQQKFVPNVDVLEELFYVSMRRI